MLLPGAFVPLAEDTGLIKSVTRWVLAEAIRQGAEWSAAGLELRMGVNLSARDVTDPALPELVETLLLKHGMPGSALQLEITETELLGDARDAGEVLERLARAGVSWAIDDFGTGYSSLDYLRRFPMDVLKIDRSFTCAAAAGDPLLRAIVAMGQSLGLILVPEGIEDADQAAALRELGCSLGQGFHYGRPAPAETLLAAAV
jgi:EAL domain-containing protein (putative c-di-GMP-specific phosphodiesterase class I)